MVYRYLATFVITLVCTTLISACGQDSQESYPSLSNEITVYTNMHEEDYLTYLKIFKQDYPQIQVKVVSKSPKAITEQLLVERANPVADVIWGMSLIDLMSLKWQELLAPHRPASFNDVRPQFRDASHHPPLWVGMSAWLSVFCVDTMALTKLGLPLPIQWKDLVRPDYRGHLMMPDPMMTGTGYMIIATLLQYYGESEGWPYLDTLHHNVKAYTVPPHEPCQRVAQGEAPIGISSGLAGSVQSLELIFPAEGSVWDIEGSALVDKVDVKLAALRFYNWVLSKQAFAAYAPFRTILAMPMSRIPPEGFPDDPIALLFDVDFPWTAANRYRIQQEWRSRHDDQRDG